MKVKLDELINEDLMFNVCQGLGIFDTDGIPQEENLKHDIIEDVNKKIIKCLYFKQLFELLNHCSKDVKYYGDFVQEVERKEAFNSFAMAIQILIIPHSLRLDFASENEEKYLEDIMSSCYDYILTLTKEHGRRILKGIKEVKDKHYYISLTSLDPELPEEYSAKVLLQLTQGFLKLVEIEKANENESGKQEVRNLLCEKWDQHLVTCTEFWVGNDSSPVINLKGKILLNFLCQLSIPQEKLCSWLTDKNSDFQKCIDSLCKYIGSNTEVIEYLVARTPELPTLLNLWVPIINTLMQSVEDSTEILKCFIRYLPREWKDPIEDDDRKADQLRTYSVLAHYCIKVNLLDESVFPECNELLTHFLNQINEHSHDKHPVFVKYECLNLTGIIYNLKSPNKSKSGNKSNIQSNIIGEVLCNSINRIMNQYFPLWSHEIRPDTREKRYYEMIFDGLINLIRFSKNTHALKLLYRVIKEDKTLLEYKLEHALHVLVTKGFNKLSLSEFLIRSKIVFAEFIDFDSDEFNSVSYFSYNFYRQTRVCITI